MITQRRYELDWLRVIAFLVLIYFHAAILFIPGGIPQIQNAQTSTGLGIFVDISSQFRLALLFLISGVGVAFAKRRLNNKQFLLERSKRLLIPFVVGVLFIVPPMIYAEKLFLGEFNGSYWAFYPQFFTEGVYPSGNLSWHHFWFIAYLYLFCVLAIKVFGWMEISGKTRLAGWVSHAQGMGIYRMVLPLFVVEVLLRAVFPGFRDLIHDWASFFHWFMIFLAGYVLANNAQLLDNIRNLRFVSLGIALVSTLLLYLLFDSATLAPDLNDPWLPLKYVVYCAVRMLMVWSCLLSCLGFASRFLNSNHPVLAYVNEAVFPLFSLHLTIITVLGYWVVATDWSLAAKYLFVTSATCGLILLFYHFAIRPFNVMRLLFGVKAKPVQPSPNLARSS